MFSLTCGEYLHEMPGMCCQEVARQAALRGWAAYAVDVNVSYDLDILTASGFLLPG